MLDGFSEILILCNYCATMGVSSSNKELIHQSAGQTAVKIRVSRLKPYLFLELKDDEMHVEWVFGNVADI